MFKKVISMVLACTCIAAFSTTAFAKDLMLSGKFYDKQIGYDACTLSSAAMMLSRRAYLNGDENWQDITETALRPVAWSNGLTYQFTYHGMTVGHAFLSSQGNEEDLIAVLEEHPEGIVAYNRYNPHAILLTDYTDGIFYCADPAPGASFGRIPASASTILLSGVNDYWYVSADSNEQLDTAPIDKLTILGLFYPENLAAGQTFSLGGLLKMPEDTTLTEVSVKIIDETGTVLQEATDTPTDGHEWAFRTLDKDIQFDILPSGTYGFSFVARDNDGNRLCFSRSFTVSSDATITAYYWSANDPAYLLENTPAL